MKRHWGRLTWVSLTNLPICAFLIYELIEVHEQALRAFASSPPAPSVWSTLSDNYHLLVALTLAGLGFTSEALNRRAAGFINCGLWAVVLAYELFKRIAPIAVIFFVLIVAMH